MMDLDRAGTAAAREGVPESTSFGRTILGRLGSVARRHTSLGTPVALLVVLLIISAAKSPYLFSSSGLAGLITAAAPVILATLALTPIAIAGPVGTDLSIGPLMTFINIGIVLWVVGEMGINNPAIVFLFAIVVGIIIEVAMGALIGVLRLGTIIVTLAGYLILSGISVVLLPQPGGNAPPWLASWSSSSNVLSPALYVLLGAFGFWWLVSRTTFFRNMRLMGANERTAFVSGLRMLPARLGAHVLAGVFAGLAAIMYTSLIGSADARSGLVFTLSAVTALILGGASLAGGRASAVGSVLGAIDIWLVSYVLATFNFGMNAGYTVQIATGTILVVSLLVGGLLAGSSARRRQRVRKLGGSDE